MEVINIQVVKDMLEEKIECLSQARLEALQTYNTRDYAVLAHLVDALNATRDYIKSLPTFHIPDEIGVKCENE